MKVSVVTPTIRKEGLDLVKKALDEQEFRDFEWLIGSPFDPEIASATWVKDDFKGGFWTLNRIYNKLFEAAKGEIIVTLQDWIYVLPDGLEKFVTNIDSVGGIHTGVGDQYRSLNKYGYPEGKIWSDPRKTTQYGTFYEINFNDCEWNWAAFKKADIEAIGGMDEQLDFLGFGGDQYQVCDRWNDAGHRFFIDQTNESFTLRHDREKHGGQEYWDANHVLLNGKYNMRKHEMIKDGTW